MSLVLYYAPGSCAFAAIVALEMAGAQYEARRVNLQEGEQREPAFKSISPLGRVPALIVDELPVSELIAVLTYCASRFPDAGLLPAGSPLQLARAYETLSWFSTSLHAYIAQIFRGERMADDEGVKAHLKAVGRERFVAQLPLLEQRYAVGSGYLAGPSFTVVDAFSIVIWRWAQKLEIDVAAYPNWSRAIARDLERPDVQRASHVEASGNGSRTNDPETTAKLPLARA